MQNENRWLTAKEICAYLSISRQTLMFWIETRNLAAVKLGKFGRCIQGELGRWIRGNDETRSNKEV